MLRSERLRLHCLSFYIYAFDSVPIGDSRCHSPGLDPTERTTCVCIRDYIMHFYMMLLPR